ncbi:MAG: dihydroorotate dehydrogenase [Eubacteriales bacterium]|jgi:dihydroorotate dehydrogenase (NAD+) catalytic subunit
MVDTKITLCGIDLDNPVIPASGTFGYGHEFAELYDINILGTFSFKGTTQDPRFGNPTPRVAEVSGGMLNSVGLQNPGVRAVIEEELPRLARVFKKPVMANISGFSPEEYESVAAELSECKQIGWIEVNISCPNVHGGGIAFGTDPALAAEVVRRVRRVTNKPLIIKLSPNVTDICEIAMRCEAEGADALSLINTLVGMQIDLKTKKPVLANVVGGYSGPGIFPVALRMVYQVYKSVGIPIVGMGGVSSAEDVLKMMAAGATAVQVGSANLVNPYVCRDIIAELPRVMEKYGVSSLRELTGAAHR